MPLIRAGAAPVVPQMLRLKDAEEELRRSREQARQDGFELGQRQGFEHGMIQGRAEGFEQARRDHEQVLRSATDALINAAARVDAVHDELRASAAPEVLKLAVALARRITKRQAEIDPQVAVANLEAAVGLITDATRIRIAVNPRDGRAIAQALEMLRLQHPFLEQAPIVQDEGIAQGGCRVFTEHGLIDAELDTQLDRLVQQILPGGNT